MKKKSKIEKENDKVVKKIVIGVALYAILMAALIIKLGDKEEELELNSYLIIDDVYYYQYIDEKIKTISVLDADYEDHLFDVYSENEFAGTYYVATSQHEYVNFRKKGSSGMYRPTLPYIAATQDIDIIEYKTDSLKSEDVSELANIMMEKEVTDLTGIDYSYKVTIDLDDDNYKETIYVVSNYNYINTPDIAFSIVYIVDENGVTILEEDYVTSENILSLKQYALKNIIDLDGEEKYTLIISSSDYDETYLEFYKTKGNIYENITSN